MTNMLLSYPTGLVACASQLTAFTPTPNKLVGELQCMLLFPYFPFASCGWWFEVSDSFDVFKACKDGWFSMPDLGVDNWYWWWMVWSCEILGGLLGRQVEGYDQRFTTQTMTLIGATKIHLGDFWWRHLMILLDLNNLKRTAQVEQQKLNNRNYSRNIQTWGLTSLWAKSC